MNHSKLIDELLNELSYRVGIVNLKNKNQQSINHIDSNSDIVVL